MAFGERLQEVRRENGLTQEQFAEALQVSRQAVSRWESGRSYPEVDKILYICNRYGVSLGTLFSEEVPLPDSDRTQAPQEVAAPPQRPDPGAIRRGAAGVPPGGEPVGVRPQLPGGG